MLKKIMILSIISNYCLASLFINPLGMSFRSVDTGGTLKTIDAYKDGIGVIIVGDNQFAGYNDFILKYGDVAKTNNSAVLDYVINSGSNPVEKELALTLKNVLTPIVAPIIVLPSFNNTCSGGFGGDPYSNSIYCDKWSIAIPLTSLNSGWLNLKSLPDWNELGLSYNNLSDLTNLNNLTNVTYLDVQYNPLLTSLVGLNPTLKIGPNSGTGGYLYLNNTKLSSIEQLRNMDLSSLEEISLHSISTLNDISPLINISTPVTVIYFDNRNYTGKLPANSYLCTTGYNNNQLKANTGSWPAPNITKSFVCAP